MLWNLAPPPENVLFPTISIVTLLSLVSGYLEQLDYRMLKNLRLTVYGWHT